MIEALALDLHNAKEIIDDLMVRSVALEAFILQSSANSNKDQPERATDNNATQK